MSTINGITKLFTEKGLQVIPEPTDKDRFLCFDDGAVEVETGELIYGFVRRLKPEHCLSTGVYTGISDLYIARALQDNNFGHLDAVEYEKFHIMRAEYLWMTAGVASRVVAIQSDSMKFKPEKQYQFMFLDTEMHLRFHELVNFYPFLDEGGYVFVHDVPRNLCQGNVNPDHPDFAHWPIGELPQGFVKLIKERKLMPFHFGSARGLVGYYKVHHDDYGI